MSSRLVAVSNRVPAPSPDGASASGLVSALASVVGRAADPLWFGWSGRTGDPAGSLSRAHADGIEFATIDLSEQEVRGYYDGFCNQALWPAMHGLPERIAADAESTFRDYCSVNCRFADELMPLLRPDDLVWVHDYHLVLLGEELRHRGFTGRIGYFHHVPVPGADVWPLIPHIETLSEAWRVYDVIGVQTERDAERLRSYLPASAMGRVAAFGVSIEPEELRGYLRDDRLLEPLPAEGLATLYFGVDRLDYTKAIPQRLRAYGHALDNRPDMRPSTRFVQWAAPSRTALPEYGAERIAVENVVRSVNDRFPGEPIHVEFEQHPRREVIAALAQADVCVVTSVADGMNLVAKEYAAVHSDERPGVLILSDSCGAAAELSDALIYEADDPMALTAAIMRAHDMPVPERRERSQDLRRCVDRHTSADWARSFLAALAHDDAHASRPRSAPAPAAASSVPARRDVPELATRGQARLQALEGAHAIERIWARDHTLWAPAPDGIVDRLGWLDLDVTMRAQVERIQSFAAAAARDGFTRAVLLGMGGSAMAPRVYASLADRSAAGLRLDVLDSTVPQAVHTVEQRVDPGRTLYIVASKSGTTAETVHLMEHFWARESHGDRFVAITDPGTPLEGLARERGFRDVFCNPPDLGGRYSALSLFGLVPAALAGVNIQRVLDGATVMRMRCGPATSAQANPGVRLGAMLAEAVLMDRDVLAIPGRREHQPFGAWIEQLVAESTGKHRNGVLPVVGPDGVANSGDGAPPPVTLAELAQLSGAGGESPGPEALGADFYRWQFAIATAGAVLALNPFDQPDVEATKRAAARFLAGDELPADGGPPVEDVLRGLQPDQYLGIHAYLAPSRPVRARLERVRHALADQLGVPATLEYGPSFLHSTGQYHKAGRRRGVFVQLVDSDDTPTVPAWHGSYTLGQLTRAEADGDRVALAARGRAVARASLEELEATVRYAPSRGLMRSPRATRLRTRSRL